MIKIEKGINIPAIRRRNTKYPLSEMDIGDSFFTTDRSQNVRSYVNSFARRYTKKFTCRFVKGGIRVWRVT